MKLILILILLSGNFLFGHCPKRELLYESIVAVNKLSNEDPHKKLKDLLAFENIIKNCGYINDSTHAFLLQRIGAAYHNIDDYKNAITYTKQAISIISKNFNKPSIDYTAIIKDYYNLSVYYDSLDMQFERNMAVDSCVTIALKLGFVSAETIYLIAVRARNLLKIGDYSRGERYTEIGTKAIKNYHEKDSIDNVSIFLNFKVMLLKKYKKYAAAEDLLLNKLYDYHNAGFDSASPELYESLAIMKAEKANYATALLYFITALKYSKKDTTFISGLQIENNTGYHIYFMGYRDYKKALECYRRALG